MRTGVESSHPLHIVLVEPEIPPNTGNIGRLCVGAGVKLHLIEPLGFSLDETRLRRAGLDYWQHLDLKIWPSFAVYLEAAAEHGWRLLALSSKVRTSFLTAKFQAGDHLLFGRETRGLPESFLESGLALTFRIPMRKEARSYNLGNAVAIVLSEALRQTQAWPE